ncbi:hypothetical protein BGZ73_000384 [Actinomortierella ambigua]|nr:hypothetical protein BGZ73_000384 [Actinomortierella ambigua]
MSHANYDVLTLIIDNVVDVGTLFTFLTVSKQTFYWASRALYRDPAFFLEAESKPRERAATAFIQLVLAISPANDSDTNKLRQVFRVQKTCRTPMLDYLSLIQVARWKGVIETCALRRWDELGHSFQSQAHVSQCFTEAACYHQLDNIAELEILSTAIEKFIGKASTLSRLRRIVIQKPSYLEVNDLHRLTIRLVMAIQLHHGQASLRDCEFSMDFARRHLDRLRPLFRELNTLLPPPGVLRHLLVGSPQTLDRYLPHLSCISVSPNEWQDISRHYPNLSSGQILQRCRGLRSLTISDFSEKKLLAWAASEASDRASGSLLVPAVPLEDLYVNGATLTEEVAASVVRDALFGFAASLRMVNVSVRPQREGGTSVKEKEEAGPLLARLFDAKIHRLPQLRDIRFGVPSPKLFDPRLVQISPNLKHLYLSLNCLYGVGSPCQTWPLFHCPALLTLSLKGAAICAFDPASLANMPCLRELTLSQKQEKLASDALLRMKRWTWEWDLPNLEELSVYCTMDGWFNLKILRGCPRLKTMKLETRWQSLLAVRSVLDRPGFEPPKEVKKVTFTGPWKIARTDIHYLVKRVFPRMTFLTLSDMSPRVGRDMIMATRHHPTLAIVELLDPISHQEIENIGLIRRNTGRVETERDSEYRSRRQEVEDDETDDDEDEKEEEEEEDEMREDEDDCLYLLGEEEHEYQWRTKKSTGSRHKAL